MERPDESNFVPADIENRKLPNLIRMREDLSQSGEASEAVLSDNPIPARE
jgi:hypothetical protein